MENNKIYTPYEEYTTSSQYNKYLATSEWQNKATLIKRRDGNKCLLCGNTENLVVHHLRYDDVDWEHPGCESDCDLVTLCRGCHKKFHDAELNLRIKFEESFAQLHIDICNLIHDRILEFYEEFLNNAIEENKKYETNIKAQSKQIKSQLRKQLGRILEKDKEMGKIKDLVPISFNVDSSIKCQKPQIIDRTKECIRLWEQLAEEQKQKSKDRLARFDPFAFIEHLEECPW